MRTIPSTWQYLFTKEMLAIFLLGFSSGLPFFLTGSTIKAWFTSAGLDIVTIGLFGLASMPYTYKFIWAPLMDKLYPPILGRRTGWILIWQLALIGIILCFALLSPTEHAGLICLLTVALAFCAASQDIVFDAYKIDVLTDKTRPLGIALGVEGYRIAMLCSGGGALIIADHHGWQASFITMAALMSLGLIGTMLLSSKSQLSKEYNATPPKNWKETIIDPFVDFFSRDKALLFLLFITLFKLGDGYTLALSGTFLLRDLNFTLTEYGVLTKLVGITASLIGIFIGGLILTRVKLYWALWFFGLLQAISSLSYAVLAVCSKNFYLASGAIFFEFICGGMGTAAFCAFMMKLCNRKFSASQYALLTSFMTVNNIIISLSCGYLSKALGWPTYFVLSAFLSLPALIILPQLRSVLGILDTKKSDPIVQQQVLESSTNSA